MIDRIISNLNLKKKILLLILILIIPLLIIITFSLFHLSRSYFIYINKDIQSSVESVTHGFDFYRNQTLIYSNLISKNSNIQRGTYFNNTGSILKFIEPMLKEIQVDMITVHNDKGIIIAQAHSPNEFNYSDIDNESFNEAFSGKTVTKIEIKNNIIILNTYEPIYHETYKDLIIGTVSVGYNINNDFAENLKKISGVNNLFVVEDSIFASSFPQQIVDEFSIDDNFLNVGGEKFNINIIPIQSDVLENFGIIVAVNYSSLKNTLFATITTISILLILTTIISLILSYKISRNITDSANLIIKSTEEIANNNFDININIDTKDEFNKLAETFNVMAENIKNNFERIEEKNNEVKFLKDYLSNIFESMPSGLISIDDMYCVKQWNHTASEIFNIDRKNIIGKKIWKVSPIFSKYSKHFEIVHKTNKVKELYHEKIDEDDKSFYNVSLFPLVSDGLHGIVIRLDDITEIVFKEQQLIQAQKMETIGVLAGGLAHDFNNVLGGIIGILSILKFKLNSSKKVTIDEIKEYINTMNEAGKRAAELVHQLLVLSRRKETTLTPVNLKLIVRNVIKICKNTFDKSIEIIPTFISEDTIAKGDESQLEQVLLNICVNASHAMTFMRDNDEKKGGILNISIHKICSDDSFVKTHPEAMMIDYWKISIQDSGVGMPVKVIAKIFDPFFTTKEKSMGTGLGLSVVYNIIKQHKGFIDIYSEVSKGSVFNIYLPVFLSDDIIAIEEEEKEIVMGEGLILIIDDEKMIRNLEGEMLRELGYKVLLANNGIEAVKIFKKQFKDIKAVILDMVMPKMSGKETFIELKKIDNNVKVLIASGFKADDRVKATLELGAKLFINKPFTLKKFSYVVSKLINEK